MPATFLSFAHDDLAVAAQIERILRQHGVETFNMASIKPGANISQAIDDGIQHSEVFVFLISRNFARSEWANIEVAAAMADASSGGGKLLLPVLIDKDMDLEADVPSLLRRYQWLDLRDGVDDRSLAPLVQALFDRASTPALAEQLDAEEDLLALRKNALEQERWAYSVERSLQRAKAKQTWATSAFVVLALAFTVAILVVARVVGDANDALLALVGLAGAAVGSAISLLLERRSRRAEEVRFRRG